MDFSSLMLNDYTPKQAAKALNVSESSVKRWCDQGEIDVTRTCGGHRRIPYQALHSFATKTKRTVDSNDLPTTESENGADQQTASDNLSTSSNTLYHLQQRLLQSLLRGDEGSARELIMKYFSRNENIAELADLVLAPCFRTIGELWQSGEIRVYEERQAVTITLHILHELRRMIPSPKEGSLKAIGGTLEGDTYVLATSLVESVLKQAGVSAHNIGSSLPNRTIVEAVRHHRPDYLWLSISEVVDGPQFECSFQAMLKELPSHVGVLVGGRSLQTFDDAVFEGTIRFHNLQQLAAFANSQQLLG